MADPFDWEFPEAIVEAVARARRPEDFRQETAEYPTMTRAEYETGQQVARWEAAEFLNDMGRAGYMLLPLERLNKSLGMVNFGSYPSDVDALIDWIEKAQPTTGDNR